MLICMHVATILMSNYFDLHMEESDYWITNSLAVMRGAK